MVWHVIRTYLIPVLSIAAVFLAGYLFAAHVYQADVYNPSQVLSETPENESHSSNTSDELEKSIIHLKSNLARLEKKYRQLLTENKILEKELEHKNQAKNVSLSYPGLVKQIDAIPDFLLDRQLSQYFGDDFVDGIDDKKAFTKNLLDAALDTTADENNENANPQVTLTFSKSIFPNSQQLGADAQVRLYDVIFAHMNADEGIEQVIVKWMNISTGEVLMFSKANIRGGQSQQYVSLKPAQGWKTGVYRVTVYSADSVVNQIGENTYSIASVVNDASQTANGPNYNVIQELVAAGLAIPKSPN